MNNSLLRVSLLLSTVLIVSNLSFSREAKRPDAVYVPLPNGVELEVILADFGCDWTGRRYAAVREFAPIPNKAIVTCENAVNVRTPASSYTLRLPLPYVNGIGMIEPIDSKYVSRYRPGFFADSDVEIVQYGNRNIPDSMFYNCRKLREVSTGLYETWREGEWHKIIDCDIPEYSDDLLYEGMRIVLTDGFCTEAGDHNAHMTEQVFELFIHDEFARDKVILPYNDLTQYKRYVLQKGAKVGRCAFKNCTSIKTIVMLHRHPEIGEEAFAGCTALREVYSIAGDPGKWSANIPSNIFDDSTYDKATLYVRSEWLDEYAVTEPWCRFKNIQAINQQNGAATIDNTAVNQDPRKDIYAIDGKLVISNTQREDLDNILPPGFYIVRYYSGKTEKIKI